MFEIDSKKAKVILKKDVLLANCKTGKILQLHPLAKFEDILNLEYSGYIARNNANAHTYYDLTKKGLEIYETL